VTDGIEGLDGGVDGELLLPPTATTTMTSTAMPTAEMTVQKIARSLSDLSGGVAFLEPVEVDMV